MKVYMRDDTGHAEFTQRNGNSEQDCNEKKKKKQHEK